MACGVGVFARAPASPGKTRLAPYLPPARLRTLRTAMLVDTLRVVSGCAGCNPVIFYTPDDAKDEIAAISERPLPLVPQPAGDLGVRMEAAIEYLLGTHACDAAILVGSDSPLLSRDRLADAQAVLAAPNSVVIGPADDGGYYLIGMRSPQPRLFEGIEWGSSRVLEETLRAATGAEVDVTLIRSGLDIDTIDDLRRLERELESAPADVAASVRAWFATG